MQGSGAWSGRRRGMRPVVSGLALVVMMLALTLALAAPVGMPHAAARPLDGGTLTITIPQPDSNGEIAGPVGMNLTVSAIGLQDGDTYALGYAPQDSQCTPGFPLFQNVTATATGGAFTITFAWPKAVNSVGTLYYICAQDTTQPDAPPVQSDQLFHILSADPPQFTIGDATTQSAIPGPPFTITVGGQIALTGHNYVPAGVTLLVYLSPKRINTGQDFNTAQPRLLGTADSQQITTTESGDVSATVVIPNDVKTGNYFLYLVSNDRQGDALPSLMAGVQVRVRLQPTPTASPSPTGAASATPGTGDGNNNTGPGAGKILGVVGFGLLSLILFVAGTILLAADGRRPQ